MKSKPLNEAFVLPEVTEIRTKDGDKLSFVETFKWFKDPITDCRMLMTSYEDVTEIERARQIAQEAEASARALLQEGANSYVLMSESYEVIFASEPLLSMMGFASKEDFPPMRELFPQMTDEEFLAQRQEIADLPIGEMILAETPDLLLCADGSLKSVMRNWRWIKLPKTNERILSIAIEDVTEVEAERARVKMNCVRVQNNSCRLVRKPL